LAEVGTPDVEVAGVELIHQSPYSRADYTRLAEFLMVLVRLTVLFDGDAAWYD
jgi:hypothetical protein